MVAPVSRGLSGTVNLPGIRARSSQSVKPHSCDWQWGCDDGPEAAKHMLDETGCAGVSIGRGAFYDPWIFTRTREYLSRSSGRESALTSSSAAPKSNEPTHVGCYEEKDMLPPEPPFKERIRVLCGIWI